MALVTGKSGYGQSSGLWPFTQSHNKWQLCVLVKSLFPCDPQESEVIYCGRLSLVADLLQGLFKEAYSLHKGLLELLDRISIDSSPSEEEVSDIVTGVFWFVYALCFSAMPFITKHFHFCSV